MSDNESVKVETDAEAGEATAERGGGGRRRRSRSLSTENSVNMDELRELIELIRENDFTEFELEREGFRVRFRRGAEVSETAGVSSSGNSPGAATAGPPSGEGATATSSAPLQPATKTETAPADENLHIITSPIVGTFYRAASPQAPPFVNISSRVEPGTVVCIIEAMKLMNEILAESSGEVAKIYVENGQPVEYGQPLFGIKN
jgi:acetyl-CoA carboxylase biotin carboxyl carrier protein